jgi:hypothetical protein
MYSPDQLRRGLRRGARNPSFFGRELNRLYHRRLYRRSHNAAGRDVVAADWDNLVILDACRFDDFAREQELPGRLERSVSRGSHTVEFLEGNFGGRQLLDTVYVTASPQLYRWRDRVDATFRDVVDVWREDGWDEEHRTVLPETMAEHALEAAEQYPNKRLVAHFVQPHYPFVGADLDTAQLRSDEPDIWNRLRRGDADVPPRVVREAYRENLRRALPAVERLLSALTGKTVVTSDHGNMFGERAAPVPIREWGHPPGVYTEELVAVPWLVHDGGVRKRITEDAESAATQEVEDGVVDDRLSQLGYVS